MATTNGKMIVNIVIITGDPQSGKGDVISKFEIQHYIPYARTLPTCNTDKFAVIDDEEFIKDFLERCGIMESDEYAARDQQRAISEIKSILDCHGDIPNRIAFSEVKSVIDGLVRKQPLDGLSKTAHSFIFIHCREPHNINNLCTMLEKLKGIYQMMLLRSPVDIKITKLGILANLSADTENIPADDIMIDEMHKVLYYYYADSDPAPKKDHCHLDLVIRNNRPDEEPGVAAARELASYFQLMSD